VFSTALPANPADAPPSTTPPIAVQPGYVVPANAAPSGSLAQAQPPSNGYQREWGPPPAPLPPATTPPPTSVAQTNTDKLPFANRGDRPNDPLLNPSPWDPVQRALPKPPTIPAAKNDSKDAPDAPTVSQTPPPLSQFASQSSGPPMSVVAASNGMPNRFTAPPMAMTIPPTTQPQGPPAPFIPEPMPAANFVNAFTPPSPRNAPVDGAVFTREQLMNPNVLAQLYATNPYLSNAALLQRDQQYLTQLSPGQQTLVRQAVYIQQQQMQMQQQRPMAQMNYPNNYQGPLPPDPFRSNQGVTQVQYQPYPYYPVYQPQYQNPQYSPYAAWQAQQMQYTQSTLRLLTEAPNPDQREWAALALARCDWRWNPQIVGALIKSADADPAATVRASCVTTLSHAHMAPEALLEKLRTDPDVRVRQAVEDALTRMSKGS
jgi:hypothetical protein